MLQAARADDPDSCLQYTVNALSGERQAPPKTEDGTDTEEVDSNLAMVYVRIHTGNSSLSYNPALKTGEIEALTELAAAEAGAALAAAAGEGAAGASSSLQAAAVPCAEDAATSSSAADAAGDAGAAAEGAVATSSDGQGPASAVAAAAEGPAAAQPAPAWDQVYQDVLQRIQSCRCGDP